MLKKDFTEFLNDEKFVRWVINPTPESDHYWQSWISSHLDQRDNIEKARTLISTIEYKDQYKLSESKYNKGLYDLIDLHEAEWKKRTLHYSNLWKMVGIAATIVMALFIGLNINKVSKEEILVVKQVSKKTDFGQKQTVRLPDGSVVLLNAGSTLTYEEPFTNETRAITLTGEAFFNVSRDESRPFTIQTGSVITKVLGTSFNVRAYPEEQGVSVAVETGKVQVYAGGKENVIISPNERALYNDQSKSIIVSTYNRQEVMGWREGIIEFKEVSLEQVIFRLERWYGVEFIVSNQVKLQEKYSGVYKNASLERILDGVSFAAGFDYELNGERVMIKTKK